MKKALYLIPILIFIIIVFSLSGCNPKHGQPIAGDGPKTSKKPTVLDSSENGSKQLLIACIVNQADQYMRLLQLGMQDAAEKQGVKVVLANAYSKLDREIELVNTYIKSGVDGICVHPVSVELSVPIIQKAQTKGIKVISSGIRMNDSYDINYIESNQLALGKKTGEACKAFIEKKIGGKANIAILNYSSQFPEESSLRTKGYIDEVAKLKDVKIIAVEEAWLSDTAILIADSILKAHPEVNVIWAANEGGTVGATIAVKNSGKTGKVFVFGTDVNQQLLSQLQDKSDILQAITVQQPYKIGYQSMQQLIRDIKYGKSEKRSVVPVISLTRTNQKALKTYITDFRKMIGFDTGEEVNSNSN